MMRNRTSTSALLRAEVGSSMIKMRTCLRQCFSDLDDLLLPDAQISDQCVGFNVLFQPFHQVAGNRRLLFFIDHAEAGVLV